MVATFHTIPKPVIETFDIFFRWNFRHTKMSSIKKELYHQSFEELIKQSDVSEKVLHGNVESKKCVNHSVDWENNKNNRKNISLFRLCKSAKEIYLAAQSAYRGGDEELAFILYMRFCHIIGSLQKKDDFRKKQTELTSLFGGNECLRNALNTAEVLRKSLIAR